MTKSLKLPALVLMSLSLSACIGHDNSDLDAFIAQVKAKPATEIEPLPQIKHVESFLYDDRGRRDPFDPGA